MEKKHSVFIRRYIHFFNRHFSLALFMTSLLVLLLVTSAMRIPLYFKYETAITLYTGGKYEEAGKMFEELGTYKDSHELKKKCQYYYAKEVKNSGGDSLQLFEELGDYKNSEQYTKESLLQKLEEIQEDVYSYANKYYDEGNYMDALTAFNSLNGYKNSKEMVQKCENMIITTKVRQLESASTISAGIRYIVAVKTDGTVVSTGYNSEGQSNISDWTNIVSVAGKGTITIGLKSDGTIVTTSRNIDIDKWTDIVAVAAGERYVIGLKNDGTLIGAGHDQGDGQLNVDEWTDIVAIAAGWRHTVGLDANGEVHITGYRSESQLKQIEKNKDNWVNIVAVSAGGGGQYGSGHTVGLREDGTVVAVGDNSFGQCNVDEWTDIVAVAAGDWHTVGLCSDGSVVSTKPDVNKYPDLYVNACNVEDWNDIVAIAAGTGSTVGLREDGTVVAVGYNDYNQCDSANGWEEIMRYKE